MATGRGAAVHNIEVHCMPSSSDRLPLVEVLIELRKLYGTAVPYNAVWRLVSQGEVPAIREGQRWYFDRANLPALGKALGLPAPVAA